MSVCNTLAPIPFPERKRYREIQRETERDRKTKRQRDKQTNRQGDRESGPATKYFSI